MFPIALLAVCVVAFTIVFTLTWVRFFYSQKCYCRLVSRIKELEEKINVFKNSSFEPLDDFSAVSEITSYEIELDNAKKVKEWLLELHPEYIHLQPK